MTEEALQIRPEQVSLSAADVHHQIQQVAQLMKESMKKDEHFGIIPGTTKPTLYKAGAEKLSMMFQLGPKFEITKTNLPNNHREYEIICTLMYIPHGNVVGQGVGSCTTMESNYRYRTVSDFDILDEPIPKDYKEKKAQYRKEGLGCKKIDGSWAWVAFKDGDREENPDIADTYNTILKMAKKRAHIDAVLTATAASDIFTQDLEDMNLNGDKDKPKTPQEPSGDDGNGDHQKREGYDKTIDERPITNAQNKMLFAIMTKKTMTKDEMKGLLHDVTGLDSSKDLQRKHIDDMILAIEKWGPESNGTVEYDPALDPDDDNVPF